MRFPHDAREIGGDHLGIDHAIFHDFANVEDMLAEGRIFLGHQRGIGGDTIYHAQGDALPDFFKVCGVQENFHHRAPCGLGCRAARSAT